MIKPKAQESRFKVHGSLLARNTLLTHVQVYDALSYYYYHRNEIDKLIEENKEGYWMEETRGEGCKGDREAFRGTLRKKNK